MLQNRNIRVSLVSFLIFLLPVVPSYVGIKLAGLPLINYSRLLAITLITTWFFLYLATTEKAKGVTRQGRLPMVITVLGAIYIAMRLISAALSPTIVYSLFIVSLELTTTYLIFIYFLGNAQATQKRAGYILQAIFYSFLILTLLTLFEYATEINIFKTMAPTALSETDYISSALESKIREGEYRTQASFLHPLVLSQFICFSVPICILFIKTSTNSKITFSIILIAILSISIPAIITTGSRSGLISLAGQLVLFLYITLIRDSSKWLQRTKIVISIPIVLLSIYFAASGSIISSTVMGNSDSQAMSSEARLIQYARGVAALKDSPFFGLGPGNAIDHAYTYNATTGEKSIDSYYLNIMVDSGYITISAYVLLCIFFMSFLTAKSISSPISCRNYYLAANCAYISVALSSLTLSSFELFMYYSVALGSIVSTAILKEKEALNGA